MKTLLALTAVCGFASLASAGIDFQDLGTGAPPATIQGRAMTAAPFDGRLFSDVTSVDCGGGVTANFSQPMSCRKIGTSWGTWSHGYSGNVYYTNGSTSVTATITGGAKVFQLYAEPNPFGLFNITATGSGSDASSISTGPVSVDGSGGAHGWGFYSTGAADVASVQVNGDVDFAIGEFACSKVPAPASLGLLGLGGLVAGRRRR